MVFPPFLANLSRRHVLPLRLACHQGFRPISGAAATRWLRQAAS